MTTTMNGFAKQIILIPKNAMNEHVLYKRTPEHLRKYLMLMIILLHTDVSSGEAIAYKKYISSSSLPYFLAFHIMRK